MNDIIKGRDIVVTGLQAWDNAIGSNCINIALEFAKQNRVLYVNSPLDTITVLKGKNDEKVQKRLRIIDGQEKDLAKVGENIWEFNPRKKIKSINWIKFDWLFDFFNKRNNAIFTKEVKRAMDKLGFKNIILFNDSDMFRSFYFQEYLKPEVSIYYSRDNLIAVDYWKAHGIRIEAELIEKSDAAVANSTYLADYCRQFNKNSFYVGQGCDLSLFDKNLIKEEPKDLKDIPHPRIGYVGAIFTLRLDIDILSYIAKTKPDWQIVLVGPEDDGFLNSELHGMKNVHFFGSKDGSLLPSYINYFDVCINPQLLNEVTIGNYPRKIDEYLAMEKPTVATKTVAMSIFANHTYLAETKEEYVKLIELALKEDNEEKGKARREFASSHTWENNVKEIYKAINLVYELRGKK
ncbi:MAG TPA: glycosyltransferase [Ignavibacteria bacterium]|nr:glycosyltransferase [Ignavibacteria bacterium]